MVRKVGKDLLFCIRKVKQDNAASQYGGRTRIEKLILIM